MINEERFWEAAIAEAVSDKPAPDVIFAIAADLDLQPAAITYVGDTASDLIAAHAAGAQAAWARWGYGVVSACLAAEPEHVLDTPEHIPRLLNGQDGRS